MKKRVISFLFYILFWLLFFISSRLFFLFFHYNEFFKNSLSEILSTFRHGLSLDISATAYFLALPFLAAIPALFLNGGWFKIFMRWYSYLFIIFSSIIVVSDAALYSYWGFRMDYTPLLYLKTPAEAMASVSTLKALSFIVCMIGWSAIFIFIYRKFVDRRFENADKLRLPLAWTPVVLILAGSLIIPVRGGFGVAPINAGSVYFSKKMFLNHCAINVVWNVGASLFGQNSRKNPYEFGDLKTAKTVVDSLVVSKAISQKIVSVEKPNIFIIVLESFSGYLVGPLGGDAEVTPNLNRYANEGILFTNFYASGTRTDKALPAILNGYPAQPAHSIIKEPVKTQSLPALVKIFESYGYNTSFWYGGEINFANFNSYLIGTGFSEIVSKENFSSKFYNSKWGVHDHIFFGALEDSMKNVKQPFFRVALTLSSHEPFDVPMETVFKGNDITSKYRNSVYYADKSLGAFLDWAKTTPWWKNTLFIMVADHCSRNFSDIPAGSPYVFRIPMIWTGGALEGRGMKIDKKGSQVDIATTLLNQLGFKGDFPFSKDLLADDSKSFAFYTYNEGFGFVTDSSAVQYDHKAGKIVSREGKNPAFAETAGRAFLQVLFDDFLKR